MIELKEIPDSNILEVVVEGSISAEEYHDLAKQALDFMSRHGKVRVLKIVKSYNGFDLDILKEKLIKDLLEHKKNITHAALVTDEKWAQQLASFIAPVFPYRIRYYDLNKLEEARSWIRSAKNLSAQITSDSKGNLICIKVIDKLTHEDYEKVLIPELESIIEKHGKAKLIVDFGDDYHGFELAAMWDDTKFGIKHRNDFEKLAIVGGPSWSTWAAKIGEAMMHCEVHSFDKGEYKSALEWVQEPSKSKV